MESTAAESGGPAAASETNCARCERELDLPARLWIGEVVDCPHCRATFEVVQLEPPGLDGLAPVEEDAEELEQAFQDFGLL